MFLDVVFANTGTAADSIQQRITQLVIGLIVTCGGVAVGYKGLRHMMDEGGGHMTAGSMGSLAGGATLAGGGFPLSGWLLGAAGGATGAPEITSAIGDTLGILLNPVSPLPVALLYYYWKVRSRGKV